MMWQLLIDPATAARLCLMLIHSLWIVPVLGLAAWLVGRRNVHRNHAAHVAALGLALIALPVTFAIVNAPTSALPHAGAGHTSVATGRTIPSTASPSAAPIISSETSSDLTAPLSSSTPGDVAAPAFHGGSTTEVGSPEGWALWATWIVGVYGLGVMGMLLRLAISIWRTHRLARCGTVMREGPLVDMLARLQQRWELRVTPLLAEVQQIVIPKVVGVLRPTILIPTSAVTGLTTGELEMILAHELAHVRRLDMWVNLAQRLAEAVLFFNPALWYLSRRVSALREYCCDELACDAVQETNVHSRARYAQALLRVVELTGAQHRAEVAALTSSGRSPSELRRRVARLFGEPIREPLRLTRSGVIIAAALVVGLIAIPFAAQSEPSAERVDEVTNVIRDSNDGGVPVTRPLTNGLQVELLAIGTHGEQPQRWWNAAGKPLPDPPFHLQGGSVSADRENNEVRRELVFRIPGLPKGARVEQRLSTKGASGNGAVVLDGKENPTNYYSKIFGARKGVDTLDLLVGVAAGEWETVTEGNGNSSAGLHDKKGVVFSGAFAKDGGTVFIVSDNFFKSDTRLVAIDKAGETHKAGRISRNIAAGTVNQSQWTFNGISPDEIATFKFQTRDFEWVEFRGLPLQPDAVKRHVAAKNEPNEESLLRESKIEQEESQAPDQDSNSIEYLQELVNSYEQIYNRVTLQPSEVTFVGSGGR